MDTFNDAMLDLLIEQEDRINDRSIVLIIDGKEVLNNANKN